MPEGWGGVLKDLHTITHFKFHHPVAMRHPSSCQEEGINTHIPGNEKAGHQPGSSLKRFAYFALLASNLSRTVHQLNDGHWGLVASTEAALEDTQVTAWTILVAWTQVIE